jgi:hypothetical protein
MFEKARIMNRRTFLNGTLTGFARVELPACRFSVEQGISNPGLRPLPNQADHRLPGIMPLFWPDHFVRRGLFDAGQARGIGKHDVLRSGFALKRSLRTGDAGEKSGVVEIRKLFLE